MVKAKAKERREVEVSERKDGIPRFELRMRWTNKAGEKQFLTKRFVFDPNAKSGPLSRAQALGNANHDAILKRTSRRLHDKSRSRVGEAWTVGDLLERLIKELTPQIAELKLADKETKVISQKVSYARMILGLTNKTHTANVGGFPDLCTRRLVDLLPAHFGGKEGPLAHRLKGMNGELAPADSVRRMIGFFSTTFKYAQNVWGIDFVNPCQNWKVVDLPDPQYGRERTLSKEEWDRVQVSLKSAWPATRVAIYVVRFSAARRGEVVKLKWEDLKIDDVDKATAMLLNTKSPKKNKLGAQPTNRHIPLPPHVAELLIELRKELGVTKGYVFVGPKGARIVPDSITQAWNRACKRAGVMDARLHDLRHRRVTELGHLMSNPLQIAKISGHKDLKVLQRY